MAGELEQLEKSAGVYYGAAGPIWVMVLFARPTKDDMLTARPALAAMARREPRGFPTLTWILPEAGLSMDNDARTAAAEVTSAFDKQILAQATLIEGTGFQVATVRAIVAGLDMMSRTACPKKVFSELGPAVDWCARKSTVPDTLDRVAALTKVLAEMRATLVRS